MKTHSDKYTKECIFLLSMCDANIFNSIRFTAINSKDHNFGLVHTQSHVFHYSQFSACLMCDTSGVLLYCSVCPSFIFTFPVRTIFWHQIPNTGVNFLQPCMTDSYTMFSLKSVPEVRI